MPMHRKFWFLFVCFALSFSARAEIVKRESNEAPKEFVKRTKPTGLILDETQVIETLWNRNPVIIAIYEQNSTPYQSQEKPGDPGAVVPVVFAKIGKTNSYEKLVATPMYGEREDPHVISIFFAKADKSPNKKLFIMTSGESGHADFSETIYGLSVYDYVSASDHRQIKYLEKISRQLDPGTSINGDVKSSTKARFTNAADIKKELKRLGF